MGSLEKEFVRICINVLGVLFWFSYLTVVMVNLPGPNEQPAREVGERGERSRERAQRGFRRWGVRFGRHREEMRIVEPTSLHQLEALAWRSVEVMEKYEFNRTQKKDEKFNKAMELLRLQYNMVSVCFSYGLHRVWYFVGHFYCIGETDV